METKYYLSSLIKLTMLKTYPASYPMTGRNKKFRVRIDGRVTGLKERMCLVRRFKPYHFLQIGNVKYISPEAYNEPIENLRDLKNEAKEIYKREGHELVMSEMIDDFNSELDKVKYKNANLIERVKAKFAKRISSVIEQGNWKDINQNEANSNK